VSEALVAFLSAVNVMAILTGIGGFLRWRAEQQAAIRQQAEIRKYSDADKVQATLAEQNARQHERIDELERFMERVLAERAVEVKDLKIAIVAEQAEKTLLREDVARCEKQHAETRVEAAIAKSEATNLRAKVDENEDRIADLMTTIQLYAHKIQRLETVTERRDQDIAHEGPERRVEHWIDGRREER
jgi:chromosome segregation ATPase